MNGSDFTLGDIVEQHARWLPDKVVLIDGSEAVTWSQLLMRIATLRKGLSVVGVVRGDRVMVVERNCIDYVALYFALAGIGAVLIPVNLYYRKGEVVHLLQDSRPAAFVVGASYVGLACEALAESGITTRLISHGAVTGHQMMPWNVLKSEVDGVLETHPASWDDPHLIIYTTGTTSQPKGVVLSQRRTIVDALNASAALGLTPDDRFLGHMPLFHTAGWAYVIHALTVGGSAVLLERFDAEEAVRCIDSHSCTYTFALPLMLRRMFAAPNWNSADLSSFRLLLYATTDASAISFEDVADRFRARGAAMLQLAQVYGLTEAGPFVSALRPNRAKRRLDSIGTPVPGVHMELLDEELRPVPQGQPGEICLRSAAMMTEYLNHPEATAAAFRGGWLHTGDIGRMDEDGLLHFVGRIKQMIRTAGENVYPREVELALLAHPQVKDCAVVSLPDPDYEERVAAAVIPQPGAQLLEAELITFVRSRIAGYKGAQERVLRQRPSEDWLRGTW